MVEWFKTEILKISEPVKRVPKVQILLDPPFIQGELVESGLLHFFAKEARLVASAGSNPALSASRDSPAILRLSRRAFSF